MLRRQQIIQWKQQWLMDHFSRGCFAAVKLFITTRFLKLYHLLPESRRVLRQRKQPTFHDAITGFLVKWCLTEQKTFFSLHLSIRQELCTFWLSKHKIHSSKEKKKALPKQISCGWLRCHNKNHWIMNQQYPEKGCYSCHKQRDVFSKLHKTLNSWPRQIQPTEILHFMLA